MICTENGLGRRRPKRNAFLYGRGAVFLKRCTGRLMVLRRLSSHPATNITPTDIAAAGWGLAQLKKAERVGAQAHIADAYSWAFGISPASCRHREACAEWATRSWHLYRLEPPRIFVINRAQFVEHPQERKHRDKKKIT